MKSSSISLQPHEGIFPWKVCASFWPCQLVPTGPFQRQGAEFGDTVVAASSRVTRQAQVQVQNAADSQRFPLVSADDLLHLLAAPQEEKHFSSDSRTPRSSSQLSGLSSFCAALLSFLLLE